MRTNQPNEPARKRRKGNSSHTTRLARRFMAVSDHTYTRALGLIQRAAEAGLLPTPIDRDKMEPALKALHRLDEGEQKE